MRLLAANAIPEMLLRGGFGTRAGQEPGSLGFAVRWDTDGQGEVSLAGAMIDYFVALASGRDKIFADPFRFLVVWTAAAIALGWLLQRFLSMFVREKSKPSA